MIILDTNVVFELMHLDPAPAVARWFESQSFDDIFVTTVSIGELWFGVERLPGGRRRDDLAARVSQVLQLFGPVYVTFDSGAARTYGKVAAEHPAMDPLDAQIAAIAIAHGAVLATRNVKHFARCGLDLIDPWDA